jgi:hypothetical protein
MPSNPLETDQINAVIGILDDFKGQCVGDIGKIYGKQAVVSGTQRQSLNMRVSRVWRTHGVVYMIRVVSQRPVRQKGSVLL